MDKAVNVTLSNTNHTALVEGAGGMVRSTRGRANGTGGTWQAEFTVDNKSGHGDGAIGIAVGSLALNNFPAVPDGPAYLSSGSISGGASGLTNWITGDVVGILMDFTAGGGGTVSWYINGVLAGSRANIGNAGIAWYMATGCVFTGPPATGTETITINSAGPFAFPIGGASPWN